MQDLTPQEIIARDRSRLAAALQTGVVQNPDEEAGLRREATQRGMAPEVLRTAKAQKTPLPPALGAWYDMPERAPRAAGFLSNPQNAAIAHDDTDNLTLAEQTMGVLKGIGGSLYAGLPRTSAGLVGLVEGAQDVSDAVLGAPFRAVESLLGTNVGERNRQFTRKQTGDYRRYLMESAAAARPQTDNKIAQAAYSGVESIVPSALGVLTGLIAGPGAGAAVIAAPTGGEAYGRARDQDKAIVPALTYGAAQGSAEFLGERIGLGPLLDGLKMGSPFLQTFVKTQIAEQVGEQATTVLQDFTDYAMLNPGQTFAEFLAERPDAALQTAVATAVGSGATTTGAYAVQATAQRLDRNDRQRRAAMRDNNLVQQLNAVAEASKVRARSPETFEQFVGDLAQDGPVDTLYVDAQTFNQTLEAAGISVADVEAAVPAVAEQLTNALRDGGDLAIPVEQFAARISGTDFAQPLLDHLRVNPALPSRAEVMALGQEANTALQAEVEAVLTAEVTTDAFRQSAERVKASLAEQLNTAGRFTKDVNDAYASLPAAYYTVRAAQLGITPEEMAARYPLQIRAELPAAAGQATLDQGELQELLAAARSRIAAREELVSKLAAQAPDGVRLRNGERRALVSRDPSVPGKFRVTFFDAQGPSNHLELGTYEEALQEAVKAGFAPEGNAEFGQAPLNTQTEAFRAWFGDSKVVDENGAPLVVYHGTPGPAFEAFDAARPGVTSALWAAVETQRQGFYFTADQDFARSFADQQRARAQGTVLPVYLAIQNPLDVRGTDNAAVDAMKAVAARAAEIDESITNPEFIWGQTGGDRFWEVLDDEQGGAAVVQAMREAGYDGLLMFEEGTEGNDVDVWVAFAPSQIKSVNNNGAFDPNDARILFQSEVPAAPPFYSALARAVAESKTAKAPAAQWKATLAKTPGVKAEELEWSGINEWLDLQEGAVERQTLQDFLEVGGIELEEAVLGGQGINADSRYASPTVEAALAGAQTREDAIMQLENDAPAYAILRQRDSLKDEDGELVEDWAEIVVDDVWQDASAADGAAGPAQYSTYKLPGADDTYREFLIRLPNLRGDSFSSAERHFDQFTDVIGHARFTTRTDAEGAKVLFLEEVQSTHHEAGREEGYARTVDPAEVDARQVEVDIARGEYSVASEKLAAAGQAVLDRALAAQAGTILAEPQMQSERSATYWVDRVASLEARGNPAAVKLLLHSLARPDSPFADLRTEAEREVYVDFNEVSLHLRERQNALHQAADPGGIQNAPWEKSWSQLVMKRMIRYAADNGYDKVAWINGNQQNGGQTGGDGAWFYERNLVNETNAILKKLGARVENVDMRSAPLVRSPERDRRARLLSESRADFETNPSELNRELLAEMEAFAAELDDRPERPAEELGLQNGFALTDKIKEQAAQGFSLFQRNRGQIAFAGDITQSPSVISLLRTADLSTFLHETGHYFLEVDAHIASQPNAPAEVVADVQNLLSWFGVEDLATWNAKPVEEKRAYHEQFARGFEMFLLEGKSPTPELQTLFQRFRSWLLNVYKSLTSLNVELTDEVRDVMGRMLASAEAIQNAEDVRHFKPLAETRPPYMTEQAWDEYQRAFAAATAEGLDTLSTRTVRDMKWLANARSKALKRLQAQANDARRQVRAEVTAEVNAEPVNRARRFITRGTDENNEPIPGAGKLDLATLREMYGEGPDALWRQLRAGGKYGEAGNNGIHPDVVAENFGFASGDALVRELIAAENAQEKIAGLTDQRMLERYGDIADEQAMDRATDEAIANDARARVLATEYAALAEATGQPRALAAAARQYAAGIVNRIELKRLKPHQFFAASARAGRQADAALKKDDLGAAATAKRNQLVNMQAARYTLDAKREVDQALTLYKRIIGANDEALARSRDMALVNATRALLAQYGLTRMKNDPMGYLERVKAYDPQLYADIEVFLKMGPANAKPFSDMTFEEFQGMHDVVRQLWTLSRRTRQIESDGKLVDLELARNELGARLDELGYPDNAAGNSRDITKGDEFRRRLSGVRASQRRVESWARGLDVDNSGPFQRYLYRPVSAGATRYRAASAVYMDRFLAIVKPLEADLAKTRKIEATEFGYTFGSKATLLHAVLHTGNQSNKSKLLLGRRWGRKNADGSLNTDQWDAFVSRMWAEGVLTKADYDFAQAVWDLLDETKPAAQEAHRSMYGRYFDEVTADEFSTPFGTYRGGYVPATTDAFMVQDATLRAEQEAIEDSNSAMFPAASNGFTKSRVEDYTRELALDVRLLPMHIDKVLKFTYIGPPVRDVARLLKGRDFSAKLQAFDPVAQSDLLLPWLQRAAKQIVMTPHKGFGGKFFDAFFREVRSRTGMQLMFANLSNTAQQLTGFFPLSLRVPKRDLAAAAWMFTRDTKGTAEAVAALSPYMSTRLTSQIFESRMAIEEMLLNPNKYEKLRAFSVRQTYFAQSFTQNFMDIIGWTAAYNHAVARGDEESQAVKFADSVIRETQGSMAPEDVSRVETGTAFTRMFMQFYSFFNVMANLNATEVLLVKRSTGLKAGSGRLFYIYLMGFAAQALVADAIAQMFRGGFDDDEDDGYLDELLLWFFGGQFKFAAAMVPGVGQVANAAYGAYLTDAPYDDKVSLAPSVSLIDSGIGTPRAVYKALAEDEELSRRDVKDAMTMLGILTNTPIGALGRPVSYGVGVAQGEIEPTGPVDFARGLVTGAPSPESRTNN